MRYSYIPLVFAAGAFAAPQSSGLEGLSQCSQAAVLVAIASTGCAPTDTKCVCESPGFADSAKAAIVASCGAGDAESAANFGTQYCASIGAAPTTTTPPPVDVADPTTMSTTTVPEATATDYPIADDGTEWHHNGTCHYCPGGHNNDTAPAPMPTQPQEPCHEAKCTDMPSGTVSPNPTNTGTEPRYTGAASRLVGAGSVVGAAVVAVAALL